MKARTKHQKRIVALSEQLPKVSTVQLSWASENCNIPLFVHHRRTVHCLHCGKSWKNTGKRNTTPKKLKCKGCNKTLQKSDSYKAGEMLYNYWAILDVVEEFQVVRLFRISQWMKKGQAVSINHIEVIRQFIDAQGKCTFLQTSTMGMGHYYDAWVTHSELSLKKDTYNSRMRNQIAPYKIAPNRKVLPVIRRNGFNGYFYGYSPFNIFTDLLTDSRSETLIKADQIALFQNNVFNKLQIERNWNTIKICIRNGYKITDPTMYFDYLSLIENFGKDRLNPVYACPTDLKAEHDRYMKKRAEILRLSRIKRKKAQFEKNKALAQLKEKAYQKRMKYFFDLYFKTKHIEIVPLKSVKEFLEEGEKMNHCLFTNRYYEKEDRLILSARKQGEPIETIEVDLNNLKIVQARGLNNKPSKHHKTIVGTIEANMNKIATKVSHKIAS